MTKKDVRTILTRYGYTIEEYKERFNLIDRRDGRFITYGYQLTLADVEKWIYENLNLDNWDFGK